MSTILKIRTINQNWTVALSSILRKANHPISCKPYGICPGEADSVSASRFQQKPSHVLGRRRPFSLRTLAGQ